MFASLVQLMAAAKKEEKKNIKTSTSSGHITNLKQSILETFDIYDVDYLGVMSHKVTKERTLSMYFGGKLCKCKCDLNLAWFSLH